MTIDCSALDSAFSQLRGEIACRPSLDGLSLIVTTGRTYADGDSVDVLVRYSEDGLRVAVSDGGLTRARLDLHGVELSSAASRLWSDILSDYGAAEVADRVYVRTRAQAVADAISRVADASIALDSVQLLTRTERRDFSARLQRWLAQDADFVVRASESVVDRFGDSQQVTAVVESRRGDLVVQAVAGRSVSKLKSPIEHANWIMGGLDPLRYPIEQRLVVLETVPETSPAAPRLRGWISRLESVAYVASFERQLAMNRFLSEAPPGNRNMATEAYGQFSID